MPQAQQGDSKAKPKNKNPQKRNQFRLRNSRQRGRTIPNPKLAEILKPTQDDIRLMLGAQVHIGRRKSHTNMKRYIWKKRKDGFHIINLEKTWNKLQLAARIFCGIKNPSDVMVMSTRTYGQRGAIKFCSVTKATTCLGKWVPGTLCNPQIKKSFKEPRLIIVDDPNTCFAALRETSYIGIPVISFCGVDNNTRFVDCAIPCNNRGRLSIGLMFWLLAREILRMKNEIKRTAVWNVSVDLFFYRDPDEIKKQQEDKRKQEQLVDQQKDQLTQQTTLTEVVQSPYENYPQNNYQQQNLLNDGEFTMDQPPQQNLDDWDYQQPQQQDQEQQPQGNLEMQNW